MKLHEQPNTRMRGQGGEQLMKQWIWLWAALLVWALSTGHVMAEPGQGKVVAVVYDDSSSMQANERWVRANYALKMLTASLQVEDKLFVVWMSKPGRAETYDGAGVQQALDVLNKQDDTPGGTPYESLATAIDALERQKSSGKKLWLVVISDGGFNEAKATTIDADVKRAKAAGVHPVFIPIAPDSNGRQVAEYWKNQVNAIVEEAADGPGVVEKISKVAALLNGQSDHSLNVKAASNRVEIEAVFPLRGVTLLRQDSDPTELKDVQWALQLIPAEKKAGNFRQYEFSSNRRLGDLPNKGRVVHLRLADNRVLPVGQKMSLRFGQDVQKLNLAYLPDVAAQYSVALLDAAKHPIKKGSDGKFLICDSHYFIEARLQDDAGKTLLTSRSDAGKFQVKAVIAGQSQDFSTGQFVQKFSAGTWGTEAEASSSMAYPGYLYRQSEHMTLVFGGDACRKEVTLKIASGVDDGGYWRSPVDKAGQAQPVRLAVQVDGKHATVDQLNAWDLKTGAADSAMEVKREAGGFLLRPRSDCCLWWWRNPGPGEYRTTLVLRTENERDKINYPPSVKFVLEPPRTLLDKVLWYGCPFALLALILAIVWYVMRLLRKARFGVDSRLETEERPKEDYGGVIRPSTVVLREECSAPKRWLWPSKAEVAVVRGLRFIAEAQGEMRIDGRDLGPKHKVPGWVFDRSRLDAPSARERRQEDAAMSDNVVLKIDEGASEVWMRYRA
jgi:hypothetical protein